MSTYNKGDRIKVEFEGIVMTADASDADKNFEVRRAEGAPHNRTIVYPDEMTITKLAPVLPTKLGTVIESHGFRWMKVWGGWRADGDALDSSGWKDENFADSMYGRDFTVLLEGKG